MKLYHFPISPNSRRVIAVLHHLGLDCELQIVNLAQGDQMHDDFLKLNPNHMIPTLVDGDFVLWESNAIMQYLCSKVAEQSLWSNDPVVQAEISRWQFWQTAHFGRACGILIFEHLIKGALNMGSADDQEVVKGEESFHRFAQVLENHLNGRDWLVGNQVTLADLSVGSFLDLAEMAHYPMSNYIQIKRWYNNIEQLAAWQSSTPSKLS